MPTSGGETGPKRLASRLRQLRHERGLTQEAVAEQAGLLDADATVSVETVRAYESRSSNRSLPTRRPSRGRFAIELIARALGIDVADLLADCFTDDELSGSVFEWVSEHRHRARSELQRVTDVQSLNDFILSLPVTAEELLRLPGIIHLKNAKAFAYLFALEKSLTGFEMSILREPPTIFLDKAEIEQWADGMALLGPDRAAFLSHVSSNRTHFRTLALRGLKHYKVILIKHTFFAYISKKPPSVARAVISDMIEVVSNAPHFELAILDIPHPIDELEVISAHGTLPSSLDSTVSLIIRKTSLTSASIEYSLMPMPPTFSGLQRDISKFDHYWSLALDQYSARTRNDYWLRPNKITIELLEELVRGLPA